MPHAKRKQESWSIIVVPVRYNKIMQSAPVPKTVAPNVSIVVPKYRHYRTVLSILSWWTAVSRLCQNILPHCMQELGRSWLQLQGTIQSKGQLERFNNTLVARQWDYIDIGQKNLDTYVQLLTESCSAQIHRMTSTSPFKPVQSREPLEHQWLKNNKSRKIH